jgi:hypothetical protein
MKLTPRQAPRLRFALVLTAVVSTWSCAGETDEGGTGGGGKGGGGTAANGGNAGNPGNGGNGGSTSGAAGTGGAAGTSAATGLGGTGGNVATGSAGATGTGGGAGMIGTAGMSGAAGTAGNAGAAGTTAGTAGRGGAGGGAGSAGRGGGSAGVGPTGTAGVAGGAAGRGGTTGAAGIGGAPTLPAPTWTPNIRLNDDTGNGRQAEVTLATGPNGLALAGWMDERSTRVCAFSFTTNGGQTWSKNVSIPNNTGMFVGDPAVAIDGAGTMYAVCQEYLDVGNTGNIRMMTSTDKGATWSAVRTIGSAPDKPWAGGGVADGVVFVSWLGNPGGIKRSLDHGMTWGPTQSTGNIIHGTGITTSNTGLVHVPYNLDSNRNQLRYLRSKNNGDSWEATRDLVADMGTFCFSCNPRQHPIVGSAADPTGKYVAITWASRMPAGQTDDDVWLLYSKDGGDTWTQPIRVNDNTATSRQFESWVAVDKYGRVHVAWTDYRDGGNNETWYARSADPTKGFEPNMQITDGHGSGNTDFLGDYKGIAISGADVLVVWQDTRRDVGDIYFSRAIGAAGP